MTTEESVQHHRGKATREERAIKLFHTAAFERISKEPEVWLIETTYGTVHVCELDRGRCDESCKDFAINGHLHGFACKHVLACRRYAHWLKDSARRIAPCFGEVA